MIRKIYGENEKIPGECPYDRCSYKGCKNGKYRNYRKLFLFPRHTEPERLEKWLQNSGNTELRKKANSSIRRSGICADHFDPSCFSDGTQYFLKRNSVPLPNYPSNLCNGSTDNNKFIIDDKSINENTKCTPTTVTSTAASYMISTVIVNKEKNNDNELENQRVTRVPKLFEDYDDNFNENDDISNTIDESLKLNEKVELSSNYHDDGQNNKNIPNWKKYEVFLSDDENEFLSMKNTDFFYRKNSNNTLNIINKNQPQDESVNQQNKLSHPELNEFLPVLKNEKYENLEKIDKFNSHTVDIMNVPSVNNINSENTRTIIDTTGASIEMIRQLNAELNKDDQITKLKHQNSILRKELRRMKNLDRLRKQRQKSMKTVSRKRMSLKDKKKLILDTLREMDISPVAKAIISLQLHTKNAPYTEEEKSLATEFLLYSRSDFKKLKNAGLNFPSISSLKRWVKNIHMQENFSMHDEDNSSLFMEESPESNPES